MRNKIGTLPALLILSLIGLWSCDNGNGMMGAYEAYRNLEVVENTFTGRVDVTSRGSDPGGDFYGNGDSGTYSFAWVNNLPTADVNFDITTPTGSVKMIINDADSVEVLNKICSARGDHTFSGVTDHGTPGTWLVTLVFIDFDGDGSYSLSPGD